MDTKKYKYLVSVRLMTYNHEAYIQKAIEGILTQRTNFLIEVVVGDDFSTDNNRKLIEKYAKDSENVKFNILKREEGGEYWRTRQEKGRFYNFLNILDNCQGKYIALLDGDDYWTDPLKLQKQVDFLEANADYSLAVGGYSSYNVITEEKIDTIKLHHEEQNNLPGYTFTLDSTESNWLTKTLTAVFKNDKELFDKLRVYKHPRDIHLFYHILKTGKGYYFKEIMGVYNMHEGGIQSMARKHVKAIDGYNAHKELYEINKDEWTRYKYIKRTLGLFNYNLYNNYEGNTWRKKYNLYKEAIGLSRNFGDFKLLFTNLLSPSLKPKTRS